MTQGAPTRSASRIEGLTWGGILWVEGTVVEAEGVEAAPVAVEPEVTVAAEPEVTVAVQREVAVAVQAGVAAMGAEPKADAEPKAAAEPKKAVVGRPISSVTKQLDKMT